MKIYPLFVLFLATISGSLNTLPVSSQVPETTAYSPVVQEIRAVTAAADMAGVLWAAWEVDDGTDVEIYVSRWTGHGWLAPQPVQRRPDAWDRAPALVITAGGVPWLAWSSAERSEPETHRIYVSRWTGGRWTEPEGISAGGAFTQDCAPCANATEPVLAAAADGTLWLAWVGSDGTEHGIYAQHWTGTSWSRPVRVSSRNQDPALYKRQPRLAVGRDGQPWLVWTGHQSGVDDEIYASHWTGTIWTPEQVVSIDDDTLDVSPDVALDAQGQPWVVWQSRVQDGANSRLRIMASHWDVSRGLWVAEELVSSPLSLPADEVHPALTVDGQGTMHATWIVRGSTSEALAEAQWDSGRWTPAQLVRATLPSEDIVSVAAGGGELTLVWLDPSLASQSSIQMDTVTEAEVPLATWIEGTVRGAQILADPFPHRHLAFGDSITWGLYPVTDPFYPYPSNLQDKLSARVAPWIVINSGEPGEGTGMGKDRIKLEEMEYRAKYVLIMEGTNDVSRQIPPAETLDNLVEMIENARKNAQVTDVEVIIATIIPRLDDQNDDTTAMNDQAIRVAASMRRIPLCDPWQAFYDYGNWATIYWDEKHPNQTGLNLLADTFYDCVIAYSPGVQEETTPPTTWIDVLPAQSECGQVAVSWGGSDNLNWVVDYDVQLQVNQGSWVDWLLGTQAQNGSYSGGRQGEVLSFRVRGRDLVGNQSDYSAPVSTQIVDNMPPYEASVSALPPVQTVPFLVQWQGRDACSDVVAYWPQYRVGASGAWQNMLPAPYTTANTSAIFDPPSPQYGQTYYFQVRVQDAAGWWSSWSDPQNSYTLLAQYAITGHVYNVREQPIAGALPSSSPSPLFAASQFDGGYAIYLAAGGTYDVSASRTDRFGLLPPIYQVVVTDSVSGLDFYLPPQDDIVLDGGFESGTLSAWQTGGIITPALTSGVHSGHHAVLLGGAGGESILAQPLSLPADLSSPTLSFLVRLDDEADLSSTIHVGLVGTPVSLTQTVSAGGWQHVWLPLDAAASSPVALAFTLSDTPAVRLDEVSVGSALQGSYRCYLPLALRDSSP